MAIIVTCLAGGLASAQSGTDVSQPVPVHPDVPTILQLPEPIERSWMHYGDDFRFKGVGREVYVRPYPGTPAGTEALLEVKTRTLHRIFLLRVVERAGDARREVVVPAAPATACEQTGPDAQAAAPTPSAPAPCAPGPAPSVAPAEPAPAEPAPSVAPAEPAPAEPAPMAAPAEPEPTEPAPVAAPAVAPAMSPRLELSLHAFVGVGFAGLDVAGYEPLVGFQSLHAFGARLAGTRPGARWALEASVSGERLAGPMTYENSDDSQLEVSGSWLRAEVSMRGRLVRNELIPSASVGMGAQLHLRRTKGSGPLVGEREFPVSTMKYGALLTLGIGLQYRVRDVLLGVEFQARQGSPNDYHAVEVIWTVGYFLDQGE